MSVTTRRLSCIALSGIPEINTGDDIASITFDLAKANGDPIEEGDVLVVAQKIVSKAEGRFVDLKMTEPSVEAMDKFELAISSFPRSVPLAPSPVALLSVDGMGPVGASAVRVSSIRVKAWDI